jgi:hypothetical protein
MVDFSCTRVVPVILNLLALARPRKTSIRFYHERYLDYTCVMIDECHLWNPNRLYHNGFADDTSKINTRIDTDIVWHHHTSTRTS